MVEPSQPTDHPLEAAALDFPIVTSPQQFYVICSTPRCGSTYLAREMWRSGLCGAPHEYFNFFTVMMRYSARLGTYSLPDYMSRILALRTGPNGVFGFKAHLDQYLFFRDFSFQFPRFQPLKHIEIYREDLAAQAISRVIARQTRQWTAEQPVQGKTRYDAAAIGAAVKELEQANRSWQRVFQQAGVQPLRISYEALCREPASTVRRVIDFLGVEAAAAAPVEALPPIVRQSDPQKGEWLARYRNETGEGAQSGTLA